MDGAQFYQEKKVRVSYRLQETLNFTYLVLHDTRNRGENFQEENARPTPLQMARKNARGVEDYLLRVRILIDIHLIIVSIRNLTHLVTVLCVRDLHRIVLALPYNTLVLL
jgi:hypothetical protein